MVIIRSCSICCGSPDPDIAKRYTLKKAIIEKEQLDEHYEKLENSDTGCCDDIFICCMLA
jgi:hypothetical protein